jgi:flagellar basal body-associated protein FliL
VTAKKLLVIGGAMAAQAALAWALMTFVVTPKMKGEPLPWEKAAKAAEEHGETGEARQLGALLPIDEVVVNVAGTKGRRFCRTSITLEMDGAAEGGGHGKKEETAWMPVYRGRVIDLLSTKDLDQLTSPTARDSLKVEILHVLNAEASGVKFRDLFFTEFLVQ